MAWPHLFLFMLFFVNAFSASAAMQEMPALAVSPGKATLSVGETRTFRAVGKDGRPLHGVSWSISPEGPATLAVNGDEASIRAGQGATSVILTARADGDSAEATIEILSGPLPTGTRIWSVDHLPGCTVKSMTQAVPTANGPDLYVQEDCPNGAFIRAMTSDGREMWRKQISGPGANLAVRPVPKAEPEPAAHPLDFHPNSICDGISPGMTKNQVAKLANGSKLQLGRQEFQGNSWSLEERGSRCTISFDAKTGAVVKKRKIIVTD